jgi:phosphoribosylformylglycinamidine synthase I
MKAAVILLPGLNRDRDMIAALTRISGQAPQTVWQTETSIDDDVDLIVIPGGFSYGDYLRCGAIAARMPVMQAVREKADRAARHRRVQRLPDPLEAGLLPGALMRNASLKFVCREVKLEVTNANTVFTQGYSQGQVIRCPVAHHDGNYFTDPDTLADLEASNQVAFRYTADTNPNGSLNNIAGIVNKAGNVLGMMPHPENLIESAHGGSDGRALFESALGLVDA